MRMIMAGLAFSLLLSPFSPAEASDSLHNAEKPKPEAPEAAKPPEGEQAAKPKPKPKPKRLDKDKNCGWGHDITLDFDGKHLSLTQDTLKSVMRGQQSDTENYEIYANPDNLILKVKNPEGDWFVANMTRLGDPNEGCVFYMVGTPSQVTTEPPLF